MKVMSLKVSEFRGIDAAEVHPNGKSVEVLGKNGAGKTSVIESLRLALWGGRADAAVRIGAEAAEVEVDVGEHIVRYRVTDAGPKLEVRNRDGTKRAKPAEFMRSLVGSEVAADPLAIGRMSRDEQVSEITRLLNVDIAPIIAERKRVFDERTETKRRLDAQRAALSTFGAAAEVEALPKETPDRAALLDAHKAAIEKGRARESWERAIKERQDRVAVIIEASKRLQDEHARLVVEIADAIDSEPEMAAAEVESATQGLVEYGKIEALVDKRKLFEATSAVVAGLEGVVAGLTTKLAEIDDHRREVVTHAARGIEGLELREDGAYLGGVPFGKVNLARRLEVGVDLALLANPKLKVILVDEGSELDADARDQLFAIAMRRDAQVWIARVVDHDALTFEVRGE